MYGQSYCIQVGSHCSAHVHCTCSEMMCLSFQLQDGSVLSLHSLSQLCGLELVAQLLQAVYVGCEACAKPLSQVRKDLKVLNN